MAFLRDALHKLAQPLTAALCISEFVGNPSGESLQRSLDEELRRSVVMLLFLQELAEERQRHHAVVPICLAELLRGKFMSSSVVLRLGEVRPVIQVPETLLCWANHQALNRALDFFIEALSHLTDAAGPLEITTDCRNGLVQVCLAVASDQAQQLAAQLRRDSKPFEANEFTFHSRELPKAARVQASIEACGGDLSIQGSDSVLTFAIALPADSPVARFEAKSFSQPISGLQ